MLVGDLAARGLIGDLIGRTTGELVADVRASAPTVVPPFAAATDIFERTWYGGADVGADERGRFLDAGRRGPGRGRPGAPHGGPGMTPA